MSTQCLFINSGINGCKEKKKKPAPIQIDNPTIVEEVLIGGKDVLVAGVGTLVGTVNELFGGRKNGRSCPKANLTTYENWIEKLNPKLKMRDLVLPGVHHHGLVEGASTYIGLIPGDTV